MHQTRTEITRRAEILIAEDSPTQAAQLDHYLSEMGHTVTVARNGREALAHAAARKPHIVITDVVMPEMDGYQLCQELKSRPGFADIPVILLTSLSAPQDVLRGLECGADNFIRKPYDQQYLLARIEYILRNAELRRTHPPQAGVQLYFGGERYSITAERQQILDLLISTYESAMQMNQELTVRQLELARERDLLHTLMDNVPDFIYFKDAGGRFTRINRAQAAALGIAHAEEASGKSGRDFFTPEFTAASERDERQILQTGRPVIAREEYLDRPGGGQWLSTTRMPMRDFAGSIIGTFGVSRDITQAKLAEEAIRRANEELERRVAERTSELAAANRQLEMELAERKRAQRQEREAHARFRFLFAHNPLPMWVYDIETLLFLEVNDAAVARYGYSPEEFYRLRASDLPPADPAICRDAPEWKHKVKDGRSIDVQVIQHSIEWGDRSAVLVVAQDVTEQKRLQREFIQAQKMEAIGRLAAGVAHDFNNLLTVVNGYADVVMEQFGEKEPVYEDLAEIRKAGERAAALTRQLLAFSRKPSFQTEVLDLNAIVTDMDRMLRRVIGEDIDLATVPGNHLGRIMADPGQIEQVIMNLAVNARDAMPDGGRLTIETSNAEIQQPPATRHPMLLKPGSYVLLAVTDTGIGMDAETQARIFEPFFTTKEPGKGTGLGLSTVYGIVEQRGGAVLVYSEVGRGTSFKVYLPRVESKAGASLQSGTAAAAHGSETVLVVEDEESVRSLECRILERYGYTVLRASNGSEALRVSERHPEPIHLLVTDLVMPGMNGTELARQLCAQRPGLRVLFMSGYADNAIVHQGLLSAKATFLAKPFGPQAFARKVREVLDGAPAAREGGAGN